MAEPTTKADRVERILPWLLHWGIADERIDEHRSEAYAVRTADGLVLIDPLPLVEHLQEELGPVVAIVLTHGNHQRSAWRLRRELGSKVYAPATVSGLDEDPDVLIDESTELPGGLKVVTATAFDAARYLTFTHTDGTSVLLCGDLICRDPDGPYRFPVQPGYFDPEGGQADARRLSTLSFDALCPAHGSPGLLDVRSLLERLAGD